MRVTYVLGHPTLGGGTKVVAQHAALLQQAGLGVTLLAQGPRPAWLPFDGSYVDTSLDTSTSAIARLRSQDLVIATFWTTLEIAAQLALGPVAHFCQGYEGGLDYLRAQWPQIAAAYARPLPTLTATPDLGELLGARFGRACRVAPPPLDPLFHARQGWPLLSPRWMRPRRRPWIAIPGVFEAGVKDVPTALRAVGRMRAQGRGRDRYRVLRFSPLPLSSAERAVLTPDRYLHAVPPREVASALRACDLLLFPSRPEEGFGLPLLEALASGLPAVASRIPSVRFMTGDALPLVSPGDEAGFAEAALSLLHDVRRWRDARERGLAAAQRFAPARVQPELLAAVQWAAAGGDHTRSTT